jgi:preprotein translocase subunit YajC
MDVLLALLGVVGAFYFILLRPVMRQQRQRRSDISTLDVGDEVLTSGGFYATVREIRTADEGPTEIELEVAPGVTLRATPDAVQSIIKHAAFAEEDLTERGSDGADSP